MPELVCAADSPDWLAERRKGVTATDITAIVGLSPYESAYSLFFKKRGDIPDEHQDNDRMRLGRDLEPLIVDRWLEAQSFDIHPPQISKGGLFRNSARPWQMATPDRILEDWSSRDAMEVGRIHDVLEVKSWADADRDRWHDAPPARVRAQVLWQMDTLDVARGHVGVLFLPSGEFRSYTIEHGATLDEADALDADECDICRDIFLLRQAGRDFMDRLDSNDPPSPDASSATLAALKARFTDIHHDKEAEIDATLYAEWDVAKATSAHFDTLARGFETRIREQAGEARTLTVNGQRVATRVVSDSAVKAHTRHSDYIRRVASKGETSE